MSGPLLSTTRLVAGYEPDLPIVRGVDLAVAAGELVVILGPNGAGKSTLVRAVAGLVPVHSGTITLADTDITATPAHRRIERGMAFVPQTENVFATLSIHDNLLLAADILPRHVRRGRIDALYGMFPDLANSPGRRAGTLSGGQRQMLAIARALIVEPAILILDEPSAGLAPKVVTEVFSRLSAIGRTGVTIILVEQNVRAALSIASRGVVLVDGTLRHSGDAAALAADTTIAELYLGLRPQGHS